MGRPNVPLARKALTARKKRRLYQNCPALRTSVLTTRFSVFFFFRTEIRFWTARKSDMAVENTTNPLIASDNRMKLGAMAMNCSHGSTITTADGAWEMTWPDTLEVCRMADRAGLEVLLPVGRWKGYGGPTNFNNRTFEC